MLGLNIKICSVKNGGTKANGKKRKFRKKRFREKFFKKPVKIRKKQKKFFVYRIILFHFSLKSGIITVYGENRREKRKIKTQRRKIMAEILQNPTNFIEQIINEDIESGKVKEIQTRFPPEPNGYCYPF